jgi:hypothetical protein
MTIPKTTIPLIEARNLINRLVTELGLLTRDTSTFIKVHSAANEHDVYVQMTVNLGRIDTSLPIPVDDPLYIQVKSPNGGIVCHVTPSMENLEKVLRMLADPETPKKKSNKNRPFAATKKPEVRKLSQVAAPVDINASADGTSVDDGPFHEPTPADKLQERLIDIRDRARKARITRFLENDDTGLMTREQAEAIVDGKVDADDIIAGLQDRLNVQTASELAGTGVEFS